jgi:[pyruvate, water dikinase]-phosphate phosphotransferase / [pyruvate, water dikinase] kinase
MRNRLQFNQSPKEVQHAQDSSGTRRRSSGGVAGTHGLLGVSRAVSAKPHSPNVKPPASLSVRELIDRKQRAPVPLYVFSDSTGNLARHMVTSFLTQFPAGSFEVVTKPFVNESQRLAPSLEAISTRPGIVFHAVVSPELKKKITDRCNQMNVPCWDLTGSAVDFLAKAADLSPHHDPQNLHRVDSFYNGRINAVTFALEHDDGLGLDTISMADVVLVGVSRTGKTPTSMFLAMQGFRVANVSLALGIAPPNELRALDPKKIIGLVIDPGQLAEIRTRRQTGWRMNRTGYNEPREVAKEVEWSRRILAELHCTVLDVTDQAIEETAARIVDLLGLPDPSSHAAEEELS